jgi:hypothetical protein
LDIDAWENKVKSDGVLCGHDYNWVGVKEQIIARFPISPVMDDLWERNI